MTADTSKNAFPRADARDANGHMVQNDGAPGMTLREWYAGLAMQGLMAASGGSVAYANDAHVAVKMADALIAALSEP